MSNSSCQLQEVKLHPAYPFSHFAHQELEHVMAELFWLYLFKDAIGEARQGSWEAWLAPDPERTGQPIFSALNRSLKRGVKVLQAGPMEAGEDQNEPYYCLLPYLALAGGDPENLDRDILQLCLSADCSPESEAASRRFFKAFCVDVLSEAQMAKMISDFETEIGLPPIEDEEHLSE